MKPLELKKIRKKLGLNQSDFGKILNVGIRSVQHWEAGNRLVPKKALTLLDNYLKLNNSSSLYELSTTEISIYIHDHLQEFVKDRTFNMVVDGVIKERLIKELDEKERIIKKLQNKTPKG